MAESPDLIGDIRLGRMAQQRFLPFRFNVENYAMDEKGFVCHKLACPRCHLVIPRQLLELKPFTISIVGAPASGKSYFLSSMSWQLRKVLPKYFQLSYTDADSEMNVRLQQYETSQFMHMDSEDLVVIEKTDVYGDIYSTVRINDQDITYPQPFSFTLFPMEGHPKIQKSSQFAKVLCMYDNAGESFLPGADQSTHPVTRHLASSEAILFLLDPTQDSRFRTACKNRTNDPQMDPQSDAKVRRSPIRQETILSEMVQRVKTFANLGTHEKHHAPLIVVLTKFDAWKHLLNIDYDLPYPWHAFTNSPMHAYDLGVVSVMSTKVRKLLNLLVPEVVSVAEMFASDVWYVPVSATGRPPAVDPESGALGFVPRTIRPIWVEVPILHALVQSGLGLIPVMAKKTI